MEFLGALFLSLLIALLVTENYGYGYWMISRPIFCWTISRINNGRYEYRLICRRNS